MEKKPLSCEQMEDDEAVQIGCGGDARVVAIGSVVRKEYKNATAFQTELDALSKIRSPCIVALVGVCCDKCWLYFPRYDVDLCALLLSGRSLDRSAVFVHVLTALRAVHSHAWVHRDIKPENVLCLFVEGNPIRYALCDFARAKALPAGSAEIEAPFCGTTAYGAPEALQRCRYGTSSDMFSAGCLLFAVATSALPFEDEELAEELEQAPPFPDDVDAKHAELLRALLHWNPSSRPSAAAALNFLMV